MKYFPAYRKSYLFIIMIISLCFLLIQCIDRGSRDPGIPKGLAREHGQGLRDLA